MNRWACGMGLAVAFAALCAPHAWAADGEPMEELKFDLPEPFFGGRPFHYPRYEHFEDLSFEDRPPFMAPKGTGVISRGKTVTASSSPLSGDLKMITDGDKSYQEGSLVTLGPGVQWVQVDLGSEQEIFAILLWHFCKEMRVYFDVIVQASGNPEFESGVLQLYNADYDNSSGFGEGRDKEYAETNKGRLIDAKGQKARYLRFFSNRNTDDPNNHYVEIEVWGRPVKAAEPEETTGKDEPKEELKFEIPEPSFN